VGRAEQGVGMTDRDIEQVADAAATEPTKE
jgi:hypothetical protein